MTSSQSQGRSLDHLSDLILKVNAELDRKVIPLRDLLNIDVGAVLKLTRSAGENIDVVIGGCVVAYGEIVVIEDMIGIRITDFNVEE